LKYTQSENNRIHYLLALKREKNKKTVFLDSLYNSQFNVLANYEIAKDSTEIDRYWINKCMEKGLELGFEIKLKP
jgi:hypothetical protein